MEIGSKGQEFLKNILDKLNLKKKAIAFCVENWSQFKSWVNYSLSLKKNGSGGYPDCPDEDVEEFLDHKESHKNQPKEEKLSFSDAQEEAEGLILKAEHDGEDVYDMYDRLEEEGKVTEAAPDPH